MIRVGLTGGIGSGKSTACHLFAMLGVAIYDSDVNAKQLMVSNSEVVSRIKTLFGDQAYIGTELNRKYIASQVFPCPELLAKLNAIVHPAVEHDFDLWAKIQQGRYVIQESAILFESGANRSMDYTITMAAPEDIRIKRSVQRDNISDDEVRARIARQMSDSERSAKADFTLHADEHCLLIPQIIELHNKLSLL